MDRNLLQRRQLFWVYVRDQGKCRRCGKPVSPDEAAIDLLRPEAHSFRELRLAHSHCKA